MVLIDRDILELQGGDRWLIDPFDEGCLQAASYDVSLAEIHEMASVPNAVALSDQDTIDSMYSPVDISNGYVIEPGKYVLATIKERIDLPDNVAAHVMPRSRFTRLGLTVSAQHCNPGYEGVLTLGLRNDSPNKVVLTRGVCIAQLVFERLRDTPEPQRLYHSKKDAAYRGESGFVGAKFDGGELSEEARRIYDSMVRSLSTRA